MRIHYYFHLFIFCVGGHTRPLPVLAGLVMLVESATAKSTPGNAHWSERQGESLRGLVEWTAP